MRAASSTLLAALEYSFDWNFVVDLIYNGQRVLANAPVTNLTMYDDATALVQRTGSFDLYYQDDYGVSFAPNVVGDILSPFGTQIALACIVNIGPGFAERIPMGTYLLSETPSIIQYLYNFKGQTVSKGDIISINFKDLMYGVQRDRFNAPGAPVSLTSVWDELQRLLQLPITKNVALTDSGIPNTVAYAQDKLQACYDLAAAMGGILDMQSDGTVGMRPTAWPSPVDTLNGGDFGALVDVGKSMSNDTVYNAVVIQTTDPTLGTVVLATLEITSGPLRTTNPDGSIGPYRRVPYFYSSPFITTQAQAAAYAPVLLAQVSTLRAVSVPLVENFNPLRDLGDVITVNRYSQGVIVDSFYGRVTQITRNSESPTQTTTIAVGQ
ncbi:MAG TPA: hypothetical protein VGI56_13900 [Galbitalea sp.]